MDLTGNQGAAGSRILGIHNFFSCNMPSILLSSSITGEPSTLALSVIETNDNENNEYEMPTLRLIRRKSNEGRNKRNIVGEDQNIFKNYSDVAVLAIVDTA